MVSPIAPGWQLPSSDGSRRTTSAPTDEGGQIFQRPAPFMPLFFSCTYEGFVL